MSKIHFTAKMPAGPAIFMSLVWLFMLACGENKQNTDLDDDSSGDADSDGDDDDNDSGDDDDDNDNNDDNDDNDNDNDNNDDDTGGDADSDSDTDSDTDTDSDGDCDDIGKWSTNPPCGLSPEEVPMFVTIGFDDDASAEGMNWAMGLGKKRRNPDGRAVSFSFYPNTVYSGDAGSTWKAALDAGHEVGNHTDSHPHGEAFTVEQWQTEMDTCNTGLSGLGISNVTGFRTPFLEYNDAVFTAIDNLGLAYDCSIEEGYQDDQDGTNYCWPYTLDEGSPGNVVMEAWDPPKPHIENHPGLWEMPVHPVVVPPDEECANYDVPEGFRDKMKTVNDWFDTVSGKITGLDYNIIAADEGAFKMTKAEFLATLKYTFDLRKKGNRAPMMFGAHSQFYAAGGLTSPNITVEEAKQAVEEFLDYVLQDSDVRVVSIRQILDWCKDPKPL